MHDITIAETDRRKRLRPEVVTALAELKAHLVQRARFGIITRGAANAAYADALGQVVGNDECLMDDDREWTPVRCRDCGHTSSQVKGVDQWDCRCSRKRQVFVDAIGLDGEYLLDAHSVALRPASEAPVETEDQMIRGHFAGFSGPSYTDGAVEAEKS